MKDFKKIFLVFVSCALFAANIPICAFAQETKETLTAPNIDETTANDTHIPIVEPEG